MVLILDGNSLIGAHVWRNDCYSTCSRHLVTSRAVTNRIFYLKSPFFLHACVTCYELPSNIDTMNRLLFTNCFQKVSTLKILYLYMFFFFGSIPNVLAKGTLFIVDPVCPNLKFNIDGRLCKIL